MIKEIPIKAKSKYFAHESGSIYRWTGTEMRFVKGWLEHSRKGFKKRYWRIKIGDKKYYQHRLICLTFYGPPKWDEECRHLDDNEHNNGRLNVRWGTRAENINDKKLNNGWDEEEKEVPF